MDDPYFNFSSGISCRACELGKCDAKIETVHSRQIHRGDTSVLVTTCASRSRKKSIRICCDKHLRLVAIKGCLLKPKGPFMVVQV